ncbi:MAG: UDP-N-acetylenolpyruvoylglucosamine reductase [Alistipes finegoldii]
MIREFHQIDLSGRNSFGVGQQAARLAEFETEEDLRTIFSGGVPERWAVLSGGNNILFTRDYDGLLLTPVARQITPLGEEGDTVRVRADAGVEWDDRGMGRGTRPVGNRKPFAHTRQLGAAPVQNIGAYGCEAKDVIERVHMFCTDNRSAMVIDAGHRCFGYRESIFKHELRGRVIITAVDIRLRARRGRGWATATWSVRSKPAAESRCATSAKRSAPSAAPSFSDPKVTGNAGSFFKTRSWTSAWRGSCRPSGPTCRFTRRRDAGRVKLAAGWLIDKAGLKGYKRGRVGVHERQALVLVNLGGATGGEVIDFAHTVQMRVHEKFGIEIDTEVNIF